MSELFTVTVDDRQVEVPKGTGLVEAAQAAGIEIPVFCYEPRLGPPVGACRMCLVEIEGMPKLQAGCTLTVTDGMVIKTSATSAKAAEGQEATLEFILVNHPLDCPVCDKGGECPLQDLTFRHGPGNTRMSFAKLTVDKPIPVSPLIALDRERCILCYRCTRFSEDVAEDGQLIARNRGARTEIATFEDEPYRSPFSGNVVELCPVGALTSTLYRFDARPWDIQNVPTVCTGCAVGCNTSATIREGKVKRILSRNHPEVDRGWLCDKGRYSYPHLRAEDRITTPLRRGKKGLEEVSWDEALDAAETMLRESAGSIVTAFSGSETTEIAYALGRLAAWRARRALGRPPRGDVGRARGLPPSAQRDRGGGDRRRGRRRPGRRARADRRPLDQGGAQARRRGRRLLADGHREDRSRLGRGDLPRARGRTEWPREEAAPRQSARFSSGRAREEAAARASRSSRTSSRSKRSRAAARSIFRPHRIRGASRSAGRSPRTPTRRTRSRSSS